MSDTDEETEADEAVTESRVREILDEALAPFKALLGEGESDEEEETEDDLPKGSMTAKQIEQLVEDRMAAAMKKLKVKKSAAGPPPTPKTKVDVESDTDENEKKKKDGEEQKPGPPGGSLKSKVQKAMGWGA